MFEEKLSSFPKEIQETFSQLKAIVLSIAPNAKEKLWAGLPSFYVGEAFVRLIPFKDHINVEAMALTGFTVQLQSYKITPKNMLQIFVGQPIPTDVLTAAFRQTLAA